MIAHLNSFALLFKVIFNTQCKKLDSISESLQTFGNEIGSQLFLSTQTTGIYFPDMNYFSYGTIRSSTGFYSPYICALYHRLFDENKAETMSKNCDLENYILDYGRYYKFKHKEFI